MKVKVTKEEIIHAFGLIGEIKYFIPETIELEAEPIEEKVECCHKFRQDRKICIICGEDKSQKIEKLPTFDPGTRNNIDWWNREKINEIIDFLNHEENN